MKEIGGYLEFETYDKEEYYEELVHLNLARSALQIIIREKGYSKLYLPYYLCDCMYLYLKELGINYEFYSLREDWTPRIEKKVEEKECVYIVNYYGQLDNSKLIVLKNKIGNVLIDNTQSFFQKPVKGIDTIYSCRKYFGVTDGAYLSTDITIENKLEQDISYDRFTYLIGRYDVEASQFFNEFRNADDSLKLKKCKAMSRLTRNILKSLDYEKIYRKRKENFNHLHKALSSQNELKKLKVGTFMYPFMVEQGEEIRKMLIENKVFIPVLWPNVLEEMSENTLEYRLSKNIVPLPIDQRYDGATMDFIIDLIKKNK